MGRQTIWQPAFPTCSGMALSGQLQKGFLLDNHTWTYQEGRKDCQDYAQWQVVAGDLSWVAYQLCWIEGFCWVGQWTWWNTKSSSLVKFTMHFLWWSSLLLFSSVYILVYHNICHANIQTTTGFLSHFSLQTAGCQPLQTCRVCGVVGCRCVCERGERRSLGPGLDHTLCCQGATLQCHHRPWNLPMTNNWSVSPLCKPPG